MPNFNFFDRVDTRTTQLRRQTTETMIAGVAAVNADGSYDILIKGNSGTMRHVPYLGSGNLQVGDTVVVNMSDGDRQRPQILMPAGSLQTYNPLTFDIATTYGGWFSSVGSGGGATTDSVGVNLTTGDVPDFTKIASFSLSASATSSNAITGSLQMVYTVNGTTHIVIGTGSKLASISILSNSNYALDFMVNVNFTTIVGADSTGVYCTVANTIFKVNGKTGATIWSSTIPTPMIGGAAGTFSSIMTNIVANTSINVGGSSTQSNSSNIIFIASYGGGFIGVAGQQYSTSGFVSGIVNCASGVMNAQLISPTFQTAIQEVDIGNVWSMPAIPTRGAGAVCYVTGNCNWLNPGHAETISFDFYQVCQNAAGSSVSGSLFHLDDTSSIGFPYRIRTNVFPIFGYGIESLDHGNLMSFNAIITNNASQTFTYYSVFEILNGAMTRVYGPSLNAANVATGYCGQGAGSIPDFVVNNSGIYALNSLSLIWSGSASIGSVQWITPNFIGAISSGKLTVFNATTGKAVIILPNATTNSLMTNSGNLMILNSGVVLEVYE
jgi:hypothetical protein